jgi:long-chain acyl-CoA synthetase
MMLYERWRQIAGKFSSELALHDLVSDRRWTFSDLAAAADSQTCPQSAIVFPQDSSADFVLSVLNGWKYARVICPLEPGQVLPSISDPPKGCVHLKTTSATTGAPRVIAFTPSQLAADVDNIVATMGLRPGRPNLAAISLAHSYGFSNLILPLLLHGIPLVLAGSPLPENIRRAASRHEHLVLPAVPALWRTWHDADAIVPNIQLAISAGAPLPLALEEAVFVKHGLKIHNFYGSSECGGIAYDATETPRSDTACTGAPLRNVRLNVGEDGCLEVRSKAVAEMYWPIPSAALAGGCYKTSDLAELADGAVYLRGRATDQINVAGRKIVPEIIEHALRRHPAVSDCLVFGVPTPDRERTEMIVACAVLKGKSSAELLREFLLVELPAWQVPRDWWFVEALNANQRGKLSRAEWRRRYLEARKE